MPTPVRSALLGLLLLSGCGDDDLSGGCPSGACSGRGACTLVAGAPVCECAAGYDGAACDACAATHQDHDGDGVCAPTCATAGLDCDGACDDSSGVAACADGGCAAPLPLDLTASSHNGSTVGAGDELAGGCGQGGAPEVVYSFSVAQAVNVTFTTTGFDTVLYLRGDCDSAASELGCNDDGPSGTGSELSAALPPGTYYLIVDGYGAGAGAFVLGVEVSCGAGLVYDPVTGCVDDPCDPNPCVGAHRGVCAVSGGAAACSCDPGYVDDPASPGSCILDPDPSGETCADPLVLDGPSGTISGDNAGHGDDAKGSCGGDGPDTVYAFSLATRALVTVSMEGAGYDTVLHLRRTCADAGSEVACNDDSVGYSAGLTQVLAAGAYFLFADSYSAGAPYSLRYSIVGDPCAGDPCPGTPECVAASDFSSYSCVCPTGQIADGAGGCVVDPCLPNPCTVEHKSRCAAVLPAAYTCSCNLGYVDDGAGGCVVDPDANDWAFLVYLNGDNDLESYALEDLVEMQAAGSTPNVHIVVLVDTYSADGGSARKLRVTAGGVEVLEEMGEIDMGDWQTLADFGVWAAESYPARHYALILWDHGDGWRKRAGGKGFSIDQTDGGEISVAGGDYAAALAEITAALGAPLDLVGFDACLMGMWEVAAATAGYARYLVASEETIPGTGWPYDDLLLPLVAAPDQTPAVLGRGIVDAYADDASDNATLSLLDLGALGGFDAALAGFADALVAHPEVYGKVATARDDAQSFADWDNRDLLDVVAGVKAMPGAPAEIASAAVALEAAAASLILWNRAQSDYPGARGLAVYFPGRGAGVDASYLTGAGAVWLARSTWDEFLSSW